MDSTNLSRETTGLPSGAGGMLESAEIPAALLRSADDGADFVLLHVNPAWLTVDGRPPQDMRGRRITELFPGIRETSLFSDLTAAVTGGLVIHTPGGSLAAGDGPLTTDCLLCPQRDGSVLVLAAGAAGARERRIAALSEDRSRALFEDSPASLWVMDLSAVRIELDLARLSSGLDPEAYYAGYPQELPQLYSLMCVLDVNRRTLELFETTAKQGILDDPVRFLTARGCKTVLECLFRLYRGEREAEAMGEAATATGRELHLVLRVSLPEGARGSWTHVVVTAADVTELWNKERELQESEEKFRLIAEQPEIGICIVQRGLIAYANPVFSALTGFLTGDRMSRDEPLGNRRLPEEALLRWMETLGKAAGLLGAQDHLPATRLETLDGQERWYEIFASSIRFHGRPAIMAALIDVTAQKKALEEDAARQSQILQAAKLASIGVLAAGIAHEINNPNQAIMLAGQVAQDFWMETRSIVDEYAATHGEPSIGGGIYSEMRELIPHCLAAITDSASRIDAIISDLRDYARQDQPEESHPLDLNLVVRSSLTLLSSTLKKHTQRLEVDLAPHLPPVAGNYQKLEQVCINLLLNAGQSLPDPTGRITVTTRHDTGKTAVVLTVSDEGTGIRPEDLPHITEPFFTTRRDRGGTGLGLSVTSAIVEQHGGSLAHESSPGKGTTATVVLPALG